MKRFLSLIFLTFMGSAAFAHDFINPVGGRAAAMGGTSVASQGLWALQNNPAGMACLDKFSFGLYYENRWLMPETAYKSSAVALPTKYGCLGLSFNQFGSSKYSENKFGLAYAKTFGPYFQMGLQLDYLLISPGDTYGRQSALTFELGLQSQVTERLRLGTYLFNPASFRLEQSLNQERLPIVFRIGAAYQFTNDFVGQCEVEKNTEREGISLRGGLEYEATNDLYLRVGVQTNPGLLTFGIGYALSFVRIDAAAQLHQQLGASLQIGMVFSIGKAS